jgi:cation diffusion facilitator CzcD-associated flavoprotein CzcO
MQPEVLVIGAGPAGLSAGYHLQRAGIPYRIVDRADHVGSTWSSLYPSLRLNTAGFVSHMPDARIPLRYGLLPTGRQYYEHLQQWAAKHPLNIYLNTSISRLSPHQGGWCAETEGGTSWHPAVVLATGRFSQPYFPPIAGMDEFGGHILHARDFHDPLPFRGKRVLVVGSGPSGADIAVALAAQTPGSVWLSIRSDIVVARRNPYGVSETIWKLLIFALPQSWQKPVSDRLLYQTYGSLRRLGLPLARNRDDRKGTSVPIRGPEFVRAIEQRRLHIAKGLTALNKSSALLDDGSVLEVDCVIFATGYRPAMRYLDVTYSTDEQGWPLRETKSDADSTALRDHAGLFLVGRYYRGMGAFYNIRREAAKAAQQIVEYLANYPPTAG